jgi:endonuclease YncB( thermonuclease family)
VDGPDHLGEPVSGGPARIFGALALVLLLLPLSASAEDAEIAAPAVRDVTPPGVTPAPSGRGPLVREPVPAPAPDGPRWHKFILPMTSDSATFIVEDRVITIAGVVPPSRTATCAAGDSTDWPCGAIALAALRRFLAGRPVQCFFGPADKAAQLTAACRVGKIDIGLWLLKAGWAKAADGASDAYRAAAEAAHCARRGLWHGGDLPTDCPPVEAGN